jgi:phage terminase large subunit-like protein
VASWPPAWLTPASESEITAGDGQFASTFAELFGSIGKDGVAGRAGQALQLRDWQKSLLDHLYARDLSGGYRFQTALIGMPRKNGKSALTSAAIALYKTFAEGVNGGEVIVAAAEKEQARIVFGEARRMVESSELSELATIYKDSIYVPSTNSVMKVVSAEAYSKEGANPHAVILDELHAHQSRDLFDVFSLAMGNRGKIAQLISITTAGVKTDITGQDSIAYQLYQYGQRVARGEINDPNFFMAWWEAVAEADHRDPEAWRVANPGFDDLVAEADFVSAVRRTPEAEFRTKRLNQWVNTQMSWLPTGTWEALANQRDLDPEAEYIVGFDGSFSGDTTVLVGCSIPREPEEKPYLFLIRAWEKPPGADESWRVEIQEAEDAIADFCSRYKVREVACDPYRWQRSMEVLADKGIPIVEYPTTSARRMVSACAKFYDAVTEGRLETDGDPLVTRHLANAVTKSDNLGIRIVKENRASSRRIDAAVAAVAAYDRASGKLEAQVIPEFFF